jgi:hypothetical protein
VPESSLTAPLPRLRASRVPPWLRSRRGLILAAVTLIAGAIALGWPWLVAAGTAPLLLSAAPCLAMCALGLCMRGMSGKSCTAMTAHDDSGPSLHPRKDSTDA